MTIPGFTSDHKQRLDARKGDTFRYQDSDGTDVEGILVDWVGCVLHNLETGERVIGAKLELKGSDGFRFWTAGFPIDALTGGVQGKASEAANIGNDAEVR